MPQGMALSIFQSFKKFWKMGIIIVQDTLPGFPHTPFRPVDESVPLGGGAGMAPSLCKTAWFFRAFMV